MSNDATPAPGLQRTGSEPELIRYIANAMQELAEAKALMDGADE